MSRVVTALFLVSAAATPLAAQMGHGEGSGNAAVKAVQSMSEMMANYIVRSAEMMPEDKFSYRPTADVRSFGEIVGHVAGAQNMICAIALGEQPPSEDAVEKSAKTKAALIQAMKQSIEYCGRAYAQTDADSRKPVKLFGRDATRMSALVLNATHNGEHYGNLIKYLRINGMVPPSSQGGM